MDVQIGCPKWVSKIGVPKKFLKKFEKKLLKIVKNYKLLEGKGGEGREGGELSFQCLRTSTLLMAAGKKSSS
jgi:hypothetical protein